MARSTSISPDFGLTKQQASESGITETGQFMGTADYVSPEQIEHREVSGRTDEYALACVLYECLTGGRRSGVSR